MPEKRNILVESARIARGQIQELNNLKPGDFDALILPGRSGAVINLSNVVFKNEKATIIEKLKEIIVQFRKLSKPISAMCISPALLPLALKNQARVRITLVEKNALISKMGATEETCMANDIVIDSVNKLVTTPAFMLDTPLAEIHIGISKLVNKIIEMHNSK